MDDLFMDDMRSGIKAGLTRIREKGPRQEWVRNPIAKARGLLLASTSTQIPGGTALVSQTATSWEPKFHRAL